MERRHEPPTTLAAALDRWIRPPHRVLEATTHAEDSAMDGSIPIGTIDPRYSAPGVHPTTWTEVVARLERARVALFTTVRADGRPHATPVAFAWHEGTIIVTTGVDEQKARNLTHDGACLLSVGSDALDEGLDVVIEANAERVIDTAALEAIAGAYIDRYGDLFRFDVEGGHLTSDEGGPAIALRVVPRTVFAFGKGDAFSQTRFRLG
jgi:general stress protein 26